MVTLLAPIRVPMREIWQNKSVRTTLVRRNHAFLLAAAVMFSDTDVTAAVPAAVASYHVVQQYVIGGEGGFDYITLDSDSRRLYVAHGTQLEILDADTGKLL